MNLNTFIASWALFILFVSLNGMEEQEIKKVNDIARFYKNIISRFVNAQYSIYSVNRLELLYLRLEAKLSNAEQVIFNVMKENSIRILKKEWEEKYSKKVCNKDYYKLKAMIKYVKYSSKDIVSMLKSGWALVLQDDQSKIPSSLKNDDTEVNEWYCIKKRQTLFNENLLLNFLIENFNMKASLHCYSEKVQNSKQDDIADICLCIKKSEQERFNDLFEFTILPITSH